MAGQLLPESEFLGSGKQNNNDSPISPEIEEIPKTCFFY